MWMLFKLLRKMMWLEKESAPGAPGFSVFAGSRGLSLADL
jgi:hypothetical protein